MRNDVRLDTGTLPKELNLILSLIGRDDRKDAASKQVEALAGIDWSRFLLLARHHRVIPSVYPKLKELEQGVVPQHVMEAVFGDFQMNAFYMLQMSGELRQVSRILGEERIPMIVLKGPVLAADLYGDISRRTSSDLDVLIPLGDLDKTHELLLRMGYVKDDYFSTALDDWTWRHHHVTYFHAWKDIKLEIHWRLNPGPSKEPSFQELWQRKRLSQISSYPFYMLGTEDLFLFLVSHGARHGWSRLRWLADIDRVVGKELDWELLTALLKKHRYFHVGGQALILAAGLLRTPMACEMKPLVSGARPKRLAQAAMFYIRQMVQLHKEPLPNDVARFHKRHLFALMSVQQKAMYLLSFMYPYPMDAETMPLPKRLHFLYFPLRPFLWAWRKIRKFA